VAHRKSKLAREGATRASRGGDFEKSHPPEHAGYFFPSPWQPLGEHCVRLFVLWLTRVLVGRTTQISDYFVEEYVFVVRLQ
jgi:hypothetical protein